MTGREFWDRVDVLMAVTGTSACEWAYGVAWAMVFAASGNVW